MDWNSVLSVAKSFLIFHHIRITLDNSQPPENWRTRCNHDDIHPFTSRLNSAGRIQRLSRNARRKQSEWLHLNTFSYDCIVRRSTQRPNRNLREIGRHAPSTPLPRERLPEENPIWIREGRSTLVRTTVPRTRWEKSSHTYCATLLAIQATHLSGFPRTPLLNRAARARPGLRCSRLFPGLRIAERPVEDFLDRGRCAGGSGEPHVGHVRAECLRQIDRDPVRCRRM